MENILMRDKINAFFDRAIRVSLIVFAVGSPFSISFAQFGLVPAILFWLTQGILNKFKGVKGTPVDIPVMIFLAGQLITSIFCEYSKTAFAEYQGEWQILMLYVIMNKVDREFGKKLIKILFVVCVLVSLFGFYQHFTGWGLKIHNFRVEAIRLKTSTYIFYDIVGGFGLHLTFGGYYMMIALLGWVYLIREKKNRLFFIIGTVIITLAVVGSYARTAWFGILAGALFLIFILVKEKKKLLSCLLILLLVVGSMMFLKPVRNRALSIKNLTHDRRYQIWRVALLMIKDHPFLGVGNGNFMRYYPGYAMKETPGSLFPPDKPMGHPHNDLLIVYLTAGLTGFIGYLLMWFTLFQQGLKYMRTSPDQKYLMAGLLAGLAAFFVAGLGQCYFTASTNSMLLWFFISMVSLLLMEKDKQDFPVNPFRRK
ncbi:MAG: O-antigen ligase family protein [bacterium]|nr:O-antigen ligase family protein [bacterium]